MQRKPEIICSFDEAEHRAMRKLVTDAILATPSGEARNLFTVINIKLMRDAEASGFQHLVDDGHTIPVGGKVGRVT